jgi:stearoyl-CoA desaturase (delta-9 desaturase)
MNRIPNDVREVVKCPLGQGDAINVAQRSDVHQSGHDASHREVPRMQPRSAATNPLRGRVIWSPVKSLWFTSHLLVAIAGGFFTFGWDVVVVSFGFTVVTLCLGHTIGLHRLLIHRSFECPRWLEYLLVHLGTVVGMGGPFRMLYLHDIRDWAQRHARCHPFFIHQNPIWKDGFWQLHCDIRLDDPPEFRIEDRVLHDPFHRFLQRTWMLQQLPWAVLFLAIGGAGMVVWGICVRVSISLIGHWLVGYFAHNVGRRDWRLEGHAVQGYNVPFISLLTMGESWHNNHHAFPGSARLGLRVTQFDPGWWILKTLKVVGLISKPRLPRDLPERPELKPLKGSEKTAEHLPVKAPGQFHP